MTELPPVTDEAFLADRVEFFHGFTKMGFYTAIAVLCVVALMGIFLG